MKRILLVEPDYALGTIYTQALEYLGYAVDRVQDAQDAIAAADKRCPDAVILELQLPSHGGIEFLQEFRSYTDWVNTPVIIHTASSRQSLHALAGVLESDFGVRTILYKPRTTLKSLIGHVREALVISV